MGTCVFCKIVNSGKLSDEDHTLLMNFENFIITEDMAPLAEGHTLLISKRHVVSMAMLDEKELVEMERAKDILKSISSKIYRTPLIFEHGDTKGLNKPSCCIEHAHIHCLPLSIDIIEDIKKDFGPEVKMKDISMLREFAGKSYIFVENGKFDMSVFLTPNIVGQYIRKIVSRKLGKPDMWDFMIYRDKEVAEKTVRKWQEFTSAVTIKEEENTKGSSKKSG